MNLKQHIRRVLKEETNSEYQKLGELVYSMWTQGFKFEDITQYTSLSTEQIILLLKNKPLNIDCDFAERLNKYLFGNNYVTNIYSIDGFDVRLDFEYMNGMVEITFDNKEYKLMLFATPYYNGQCQLPFDIHYFEDKKTGEYIDYYQETYFEQNVPTSFETISDYINFLNGEYINLVSNYVISMIPKMIEQL